MPSAGKKENLKKIYGEATAVLLPRPASAKTYKTDWNASTSLQDSFQGLRSPRSPNAYRPFFVPTPEPPFPARTITFEGWKAPEPPKASPYLDDLSKVAERVAAQVQAEARPAGPEHLERDSLTRGRDASPGPSLYMGVDPPDFTNHRKVRPWSAQAYPSTKQGPAKGPAANSDPHRLQAADLEASLRSVYAQYNLPPPPALGDDVPEAMRWGSTSGPLTQLTASATRSSTRPSSAPRGRTYRGPAGSAIPARKEASSALARQAYAPPTRKSISQPSRPKSAHERGGLRSSGHGPTSHDGYPPKYGRSIVDENGHPVYHIPSLPMAEPNPKPTLSELHSVYSNSRSACHQPSAHQLPTPARPSTSASNASATLATSPRVNPPLSPRSTNAEAIRQRQMEHNISVIRNQQTLHTLTLPTKQNPTPAPASDQAQRPSPGRSTTSKPENVNPQTSPYAAKPDVDRSQKTHAGRKGGGIMDLPVANKGVLLSRAQASKQAPSPEKTQPSSSDRNAANCRSSPIETRTTGSSTAPDPKSSSGEKPFPAKPRKSEPKQAPAAAVPRVALQPTVSQPTTLPPSTEAPAPKKERSAAEIAAAKEAAEKRAKASMERHQARLKKAAEENAKSKNNGTAGWDSEDQKAWRKEQEAKRKADKEAKRNAAAERIQRATRARLARNELHRRKEQKAAAIRIQKNARGYMARKERVQQSAGALKIQATFKGHKVRKELKKEHDAATHIQAVHRGAAGRGRAKANRAARTIQARARGISTRAKCKGEQAAAVKIQAVQRGRAARKHATEMRNQEIAATKIQASMRRHQAQKQYQEVREGVVKIQARARGVATRQQREKEQRAVVQIQCVQRGRMAKRKTQKLRDVKEERRRQRQREIEEERKREQLMKEAQERMREQQEKENKKMSNRISNFFGMGKKKKK